MLEKINYKQIKKINIHRLLNNKKIIIVENCFSKNSLIKAREELMNFFSIKKFNYNSSRNKNLFHRWDFEPKKAKFKRVMLSTTFNLKDKKYFKNCINLLKKGIYLKKSFVKNYVGDKKLNISKLNNNQIFPRGSFYPSGKGYYQFHKDSFSRELILDIIPLSIKNLDYYDGGFAIKKNSKIINIEDQIKVGSIILAKPDLTHGVMKIDSKLRFKKKSFSGRFSLLSIMNVK